MKHINVQGHSKVWKTLPSTLLRPCPSNKRKQTNKTHNNDNNNTQPTKTDMMVYSVHFFWTEATSTTITAK